MLNHNYAIEDIIQATGLSRSYIDRCHKAMPYLESYRELAVHQNKFMYDSNAISVFQEIASLRREGLRRDEISEKLFPSMVISDDKLEGSGREEVRSPVNTMSDHSYEVMSEYTNERILTQIKEAHTATVAAKDELVQALKESNQKLLADKEVVIDALRGQLLFLTDGRSPAEVKEERAQQGNRILDLSASLSEAKQVLELEKGRYERRQKLLTELEGSKGLFSGKKRNNLLKLLREIEEEGREGTL